MSALPLAYDDLDSYIEVTDGYTDFEGCTDAGFAELSGDDFEIPLEWLVVERSSRGPRWALAGVILLTALGLLGSGLCAVRVLFEVGAAIDALYAGSIGGALVCSLAAVVVAARMVVGLGLGVAGAYGAARWLQLDQQGLVALVVRWNLVHLVGFGLGWGLVETVLGRMRDVGWLQTLASVIGLALATVGIGLWAALGTYVTKP